MANLSADGTSGRCVGEPRRSASRITYHLLRVAACATDIGLVSRIRGRDVRTLAWNTRTAAVVLSPGGTGIGRQSRTACPRNDPERHIRRHLFGSNSCDACGRTSTPIPVNMPRVLPLLYLMLPAYMANMAPPFTRFWRGWNRPISRQWLGEHKTVMGFIARLAVAMVTTFAQSKIHWREGLLPYARWPLLGTAFGFGAMDRKRVV